MGIFDVFKPQTAPQPPQISNPRAINAKTILVVEDELYLREFYQELLSQEGYKVITATNGQEGLNLALQAIPNAIILDIMMPVMDGMTCFKNLRANPVGKNIPVLFLTNAGNMQNIREAMTYGSAQGFLVKSNVSPDEVLEKVAEMITEHF